MSTSSTTSPSSQTVSKSASSSKRYHGCCPRLGWELGCHSTRWWRQESQSRRGQGERSLDKGRLVWCRLGQGLVRGNKTFHRPLESTNRGGSNWMRIWDERGHDSSLKARTEIGGQDPPSYWKMKNLTSLKGSSHSLRVSRTQSLESASGIYTRRRQGSLVKQSSS